MKAGDIKILGCLDVIYKKKHSKSYCETFLTLQNIETVRRTYNANKSALTVACRRYLLQVIIVSAPPRKKANTGCRNF